MELGLKSDYDLGPASARTNIAGFLASYTDIQVTQLRLNPTVKALQAVVLNAASATIWGGEIEQTISLERLTLRAGLAASVARFARVRGAVPRRNGPGRRDPHQRPLRRAVPQRA